MMKRLMLCLLLMTTSVFAKYQPHDFLLENGLRVVLIKKTSAPIVAVSVWYKCGSANDAISRSGVAHYLEHMAFESDNREFSNFLDNIGAENNAFTSWDKICFYEIVPKNHLEQIFKYEASRLKKLDIDDKIFEGERGAILEERSMRIDESPSGCTSEATFAHVFNRVAGGIPIIGWKHEIESITKQDLYDFHDKWFAPNNAIIVIVGDCDENNVQELAEKYFGGITRKEVPNIEYEDIIGDVQKNVRYCSPKIDSTSAADYLYKVPFSARDDFRKSTALDLAISVLNLPTSFAQNLLKQVLNKVGDVSFEYVSRLFAFDIVDVNITSSSLDDLNDAERILKYICNRIATVGISQEDLDAVKKQKMIAIAYKEDDIENIMRYVGSMLTTGYSIDEVVSRDEVIQQITVEECNAVLQELFSQKFMAVSYLLPKGYDRD